MYTFHFILTRRIKKLCIWYKPYKIHTLPLGTSQIQLLLLTFLSHVVLCGKSCYVNSHLTMGHKLLYLRIWIFTGTFNCNIHKNNNQMVLHSSLQQCKFQWKQKWQVINEFVTSNLKHMHEFSLQRNALSLKTAEQNPLKLNMHYLTSSEFTHAWNSV
jgi:hypothetical protein